MTTQQYKDHLAEEIQRLEAEFQDRKHNGRPLTRSVAAAYRRSIEQRTKELRALSH